MLCMSGDNVYIFVVIIVKYHIGEIQQSLCKMLQWMRRPYGGPQDVSVLLCTFFFCCAFKNYVSSTLTSLTFFLFLFFLFAYTRTHATAADSLGNGFGSTFVVVSIGMTAFISVLAVVAVSKLWNNTEGVGRYYFSSSFFLKVHVAL